MGLCSDRWITRMARAHGMIEPFEDRQVREGVISYGVSSYGYDMRVASEYRIFTNVLSSVVDSRATSVSCPPIPSPWRAASSTFAFRATS